MTRTRGPGALLLAMLLAYLAAGCTTTSAGEPRALTDGPAATGEGTEEPTRPREIDLKDVDPCALIPQSDYSEYYLDEPGRQLRNSTYYDNDRL